MKELLNSLSEMLDKKEVKTLNIFYEKVGEVENLSATITKENENVTFVTDGEKSNYITINVDGIHCKGGFKIEDLAKELSNISKRSDLR